MSMWRRCPATAESRCCFISGILAGLLLLVLAAGPAAAEQGTAIRSFPLEMDALMGALTNAYRPGAADSKAFPRTVGYRYLAYDIAHDSVQEERRSTLISRRPERIIPQAIGITEILWAICPRQRIIAVHESCRDRRFSFIAGQLPETLPTYGTNDAEIVIGHRPDLVLTTYYSDANFIHQLQQARVPSVQLGFFGNLEQIEEQILLIGQLIGEERSARQLTETMADKIKAIQAYAESRRGDRPPLTVLYYDNMGYVAGRNSTFDAMCGLLGVVNVAAANGIDYFKQVDYEMLLQWNPDMIIVPAESTFDRQLYDTPILTSAKAIRQRNIRKIPSVYLLSASQYLVASTNYLAGLIYD